MTPTHKLIDRPKVVTVYTCAGCGVKRKDKNVRCHKCGTFAVEAVDVPMSVAHKTNDAPELYTGEFPEWTPDSKDFFMFL